VDLAVRFQREACGNEARAVLFDFAAPLEDGNEIAPAQGFWVAEG
jgi:hypothetical protein